MKKKLVAILLMAVVLMITGCGKSNSTEELADMSFEDYSADISRLNDENYFDLNTNDLFKVDEEVSSDRIFVLGEVFYTNSQAISVTNNSDSCIDVYLFQKDDLEQAIQQFTLDGKRSKSFSNLTSRFLYQVGIGTEADTQISLTITK